MLVPNSLLEIGGLHPRQHWGGGLQSRASTSSCQPSAEHFEQCAKFPLLRNRGLGPLAVTALAIDARQEGRSVSQCG
jgi:hypothetical protein